MWPQGIHAVPRLEMPTVVLVDRAETGDTGNFRRVRFHTLLVRAYREWESGTRGPVWLRCSADGPGVVAAEQ
jgi:hypothetical protein